MLKELLNKRNLPELTDRKTMLDILCKEEYGYLPPPPDKLTWSVEKGIVRNFCAGKAALDKVVLTTEFSHGKFSFPIYVAIPAEKQKHPFFIHINFRDNVPDRYMPTEEIIDHGFAVISFCYKDVTSDDADFTNGLAGVLDKDGRKRDDSAGKIAIWAWAAHRAMDYAQTLDNLDLNRSIVCGHSRLGKTALLTAALDERFACAFSNDSGCSGAALSRGKQGENIENICKSFPYWFCKKYETYANKEHLMPFDQHYLLASMAPRLAYVSSAEEDSWADPDSEFLACVTASEAYEKMGLKGFIHNNKLPAAGETCHAGAIGYHLRKGSHCFSREDWLIFMNYFGQTSGPAPNCG